MIHVPDYRVLWEIDLIADNPKDAAREALAIQRNPESLATVFDVYRARRRKPVRVDLGEGLPIKRAEYPARKVYVALGVFQGVIDQVNAYRTQAAADRFIRKYEGSLDIRTEAQRKQRREHDDSYATWYECELEK